MQGFIIYKLVCEKLRSRNICPIGSEATTQYTHPTADYICVWFWCSFVVGWIHTYNTENKKERYWALKFIDSQWEELRICTSEQKRNIYHLFNRLYYIWAHRAYGWLRLIRPHYYYYNYYYYIPPKMLLFSFLACQWRIEPMECITPYKKTLLLLLLLLLLMRWREKTPSPCTLYLLSMQ